MINDLRFDRCSVLCVFLLGLGQAAAAPLPAACIYQGQLKHNGGVVDGVTDFTFALWDAESDGNQIGSTVTLAGVHVANGLFSVELDFGPDAFDGEARWLGIAVRHPAGSGSYVPFTLRQPVTPAPYALALPGLRPLVNATSPNILAGWNGNTLADGVVGATVSGGGSPLISNNPRPNGVTDNYGTVSGGSGNRAGNAGVNLGDASHATVGGGYANDARGSNATIAGGWGNQATNGRSTVGGGWNNRANGDASTVSGGRDNQATATSTVVAGGHGNVSSTQYAAIGGGRGNAASGDYASIGGGYQNATSSTYNTIAGGWNNQTSHGRTTIGGGADNVAAGDSATIAGGRYNETGGVGAIIPGGFNNSATGNYSFAAGRRAKADHAGAFVWADSTDADFQSTANNQFLIGASGGVGIGTNSPSEMLTVAGYVESTTGGFRFPDGTVQTTAGSGLGLTLPYSGSCACSDPRFVVPAFDVINADLGVAVRGTHGPSTNLGYLGSEFYGAYGKSSASVGGMPPTTGAGVLGVNTAGGNGVRGESDSGTGVRGEGPIGVAGVGITYGVYGQSSSGHAAYFDGDTYLSGDVGIATTNPQNSLDVRGPGTSVGGNVVSEVVARFRKTGSGHTAVAVDADSGQDAIVYWSESGAAHWDIRHDADNSDSLNIRYHGGEALNTSMARFLPDGTTRVKILEITGGSDLAEPFRVSKSSEKTQTIEPGMVVVIDPSSPGELRLSGERYDRKVAGVISGANGLKPGMVMKGEDSELATGDHPVALTGRVWCRCDASSGSIAPGDLLTTSAVPGQAMKVADYPRAQGAVLGKAMTSLSEGQGLVLVLVSLQ